MKKFILILILCLGVTESTSKSIDNPEQETTVLKSIIEHSGLSLNFIDNEGKVFKTIRVSKPSVYESSKWNIDDYFCLKEIEIKHPVCGNINLRLLINYRRPVISGNRKYVAIVEDYEVFDVTDRNFEEFKNIEWISKFKVFYHRSRILYYDYKGKLLWERYSAFGSTIDDYQKMKISFNGNTITYPEDPPPISAEFPDKMYYNYMKKRIKTDNSSIETREYIDLINSKNNYYGYSASSFSKWFAFNKTGDMLFEQSFIKYRVTNTILSRNGKYMMIIYFKPNEEHIYTVYNLIGNKYGDIPSEYFKDNQYSFYKIDDKGLMYFFNKNEQDDKKIINSNKYIKKDKSKE